MVASREPPNALERLDGVSLTSVDSQASRWMLWWPTCRTEKLAGLDNDPKDQTGCNCSSGGAGARHGEAVPSMEVRPLPWLGQEELGSLMAPFPCAAFRRCFSRLNHNSSALRMCAEDVRGDNRFSGIQP